jgi:hypothetical protein
MDEFDPDDLPHWIRDETSIGWILPRNGLQLIAAALLGFYLYNLIYDWAPALDEYTRLLWVILQVLLLAIIVTALEQLPFRIVTNGWTKVRARFLLSMLAATASVAIAVFTFPPNSATVLCIGLTLLIWDFIAKLTAINMRLHMKQLLAKRHADSPI